MALTDPSDWPGSMPDLRTIDNLLRCSICFEYLNVAMIIPSCSHNYCSLCIRRYMKYKRQCPSCNIEVSASELCNNRTLDELVKTFVAVRPHILKMCKQSTAIQGGSPTPDEDRKTATRRANTTQMKVAATRQSPNKSSWTLTGHFTAVKNALASTREPGQSSTFLDDLNRSYEDNISPKEKSPHWSRGSTSKRSAILSADGNNDVIEIDGDCEADQPMASTSSSLAPSQATPSRIRAMPTVSWTTPSGSRVTPSGSQATPGVSQATPGGSQATPGGSQAMLGGSQATPGGSQVMPGGSQATPSGSQVTPGGSRDKAECPVCGVPVPTKYINTHLDACLKRSEQTQTNKRAPKRKRIPAMVWKLVPDKELKKRMRDYNLSTRGKRHELVKRLDEFILMYNAQCDAAHPKSAEEISREVEQMEQLKTQPQQLKETQVHKLKIEKSHSEVQIQQSQQKYLSAHKNQFSKLIAEARQRMKATKAKSQRKEDCPSSQTDPSQDSAAAKTSASSQDERLDTDTPRGSSVMETEEVVILEDDDCEGQGAERIKNTMQGASSLESESKTDEETSGAKSLVSDGSGGEGARGGGRSDSLCSEMDTSESSLNLLQDSEVLLNESPIGVASKVPSSDTQVESETALHNRATEELLAGFSGTDVHQYSACRVLVPSSPSVASKDGNEDSQSEQVRGTVENVIQKSSLRSDPAPDLQDPLCIPESPLSAVAETRRRKRKKQDCGSNASDSGSSFGDGETTLRRSKREKKTVK